jgi:hypothetical protein
VTPTRQRWEYCELRQDIAQGVMHRQYIVFYRAGEPSEQVHFTNRENAIAQLGLEGWEMVGTSGGFMKDSSGFRVFFKRPVMDEAD